MSPMDYLNKYCIISDIRIPYYTRFFNKYKDNRSQLIKIRVINRILNETQHKFY